MKSFLRSLALLCALVLVVVASPPLRRPLDAAIQQVRDNLDRRPTQTILIIGNSRVYFHDMPRMVGQMAESAHSPVRYSITMRAWGGATFEDNWNHLEVQQLLQQRWDYVILQAESRAQLNEATKYSFETYGEKLVSAAKTAGSQVALVVNWAYGEATYLGNKSNERRRHLAAIQAGHRVLAGRTGARLINTGEVWEEVQAAAASLPLYEDGNHPTIQGSYLSALMIYGFISGSSVDNVSFRPSEMDESAAQTMKRLVIKHYLNEPR